MDYNGLYEQYQKLFEENQKLKAENEEYRKRLGLPTLESCEDCSGNSSVEINFDSFVQIIESANITNSSSPEAKVKLFMSLFRGRDDVYAKRWQNKEGKSGYSPVCLNEWVRGICSKPKIKCSECDNRNYAVLDFTAIDKHRKRRLWCGLFSGDRHFGWNESLLRQ